jgi:hypothetical protein
MNSAEAVDTSSSKSVLLIAISNFHLSLPIVLVALSTKSFGLGVVKLRLAFGNLVDTKNGQSIHRIFIYLFHQE